MKARALGSAAVILMSWAVAGEGRGAVITVFPVISGQAKAPFDDPFGPIGTHLQISVGPQPTSAEQRAAIEWSLGLIPAGQKIDSATFKLHWYGSRGTNSGLEAHGYVGNGTIEKDDFKVDNKIAGRRPMRSRSPRRPTSRRTCRSCTREARRISG